MKLTIDDYNFIQKIISLPKNKVNQFDFPELKSSQFKYKLEKINYILKLFNKESFYKRNNNFFIKNKEDLIFILENLDFSHFNKIQKKHVIITKFLTKTNININSLASELKQSRTSIKKMLEELKEELKNFSLSLEYKHSLGTFIKGEEEDIRKFFLNYYLASKIKIEFKEKKELIDTIVFEFLKGKNSSFETAKILSIILYIQFYRIKNQNIFLNNKYSFYSSLENISEEQKKYFKIYFGESLNEEINYFLYYLKGLSYLEVNNIFINLYPKFQELFTCFIKEIALILNENLEEDNSLIIQLKPHLQTTIFKLVNNIPTKEYSLDENLEKYSNLMKIVKQKIKSIEKYFKIKFNTFETLFISFHIKASLIRLENKKIPEKNVLLVCNLGSGIADILKMELNKNFIINIIDVVSYFQFQIYNLENVDFIIHTISDFNYNIPNYKVNHSLTSKDITELKKLGFLLK